MRFTVKSDTDYETNKVIWVEVVDYDSIGSDDLIGWGHVDMEHLIEKFRDFKQDKYEIECRLFSNPEPKHDDKPQGTIFLGIKYKAGKSHK